MINIPQNRILKPTGLGDTLGEVVQTFGLDLTSNLGAIRGNTTSRHNPADTIFVDFVYYRDKYWAITEDFIYYGGNAPDDSFTKDTSTGSPDNIKSQSATLALFNDCIYVPHNTDIKKLSGGTWSTPLTSVITANNTHLMCVFANNLYITNSDSIYSINTSDVLSSTGTATIDFNIGYGTYVPTFLGVSQNSIWAGYLNTEDNTGILFEWDGQTQNLATRRVEMESGIVAGVMYNNVPHIVDVTGRLMAFNGSGFTELDRFFKKKPETFWGIGDQTETYKRPIHPKGMCVTDNGTILINFKNGLSPENDGASQTWEDTIPSGIYEYSPNVGLYHKYPLSVSNNAFGEHRIGYVGGIFFRRNNSSPSEEGSFVAGATYFTDADVNNVTSGIFYDKTADTKQKWSYFITSKLMSSSVYEAWQKVYVVYKKLLSNTDKIVVKYKVEEQEPVVATLTWTDTDTFTTTTDVSDYVEGDEVQVIQGIGSGKSAHITSITENAGTYTVNLDETFTGATGTSKGSFDKWIKAGTISYTDEQQYKGLTLPKKNTSPWIQFKVCMQFTGKNEIYKLRVINDSLVKE